MEPNIIKITENVFQIIITYYNLFNVNVYLILDDKLTLIDTGHYYKDSVTILEKSLKKLGYEFHDLNCIIYTHPHVDHAGGGLRISRNYKDIIHISYHKAASTLENLSEYCRQFVKRSEKFLNTIARGAPPELIRETKEVFNIYNLPEPELGLKTIKRVTHGELLNLGKTGLQVIHTPSHTPWDISLYEPKQKLLFTGDFILGKGTSLLTFLINSDVDNYRSSLKKIQRLDLSIILPGHGNIVDNPYQAIEHALKQSALLEKNILNVLKQGKKTVQEIVYSLLHGNINNSIIWYRYIGMVDTYLKKLLRENKVMEVTENGTSSYRL